MPASAANPAKAPGLGLAVAAESLFLVNLMAAPGVAFAVLGVLWLRHRHSAPALARCHLDQAFFVSLWGGLAIVVLSAALLYFGGLDWEWTWVAVILYFTCIHSTLIVFGCLGLAKAMAGRPYRYPLIGIGHD